MKTKLFYYLVILLFAGVGVVNAAGVIPEMDLITSYSSTGGTPQFKDNDQDLIYKIDQGDEIAFTITTTQPNLNYRWHVIKGSEVLAALTAGTTFAWTVPIEKSTWKIYVEVTLENEMNDIIGRDYLNWSITTSDLIIVTCGESIQNAINSLPPEGGIVELGTGIHAPTSSTQIINRTNITIRGAGATREETEIKYGAPRPTFHTFYITNAQGITIENMYIHSTDTSYLSKTDGDAIAISPPLADSITISDIKVEWMCAGVHTYSIVGWDWPEESQWTQNLTIENCLFLNCRDGITWWTTRNSKVTNCEISYIRSWPGINLNRVNQHHVFENNTIHSNSYTGIYGYSSCSDITIRNNMIYGNKGGVLFYTSTINSVIENNEIKNNRADGGVTLYSSGGYSPGNIVIKNNRIFSNSGNGIRIYYDGLDPGVRIFSIINNVICGNNLDGIDQSVLSSTTTVINNIIANNSQYGIHRTQGTIIDTYNNVWNNAAGNYNGITIGTGDISIDPLFADSSNYDFHLKSTTGRWDGTTWVIDSNHSPCIDAGDPSSDYSHEPDYPNGQINLGAYGDTAEASKSSFAFGSPTPPEDLPKESRIIINVYPNPYVKGKSAQEKINFGNLSKAAEIKIYSVAGELIKEIKHKDIADGGSEEWDISGISSGVYMYTIISPANQEIGKLSIIK